MNDIVFQISQEFFKNFWIEFENLEVIEETEGIYKISLNSEDSKLLIGPHGKNLEILSHILKLIFSKKLGKFTQLHIEVNDYLQKKDERLYHFISEKIEFVKHSGKEVILPFFTAYERKKVHAYVSEHGGIVYTQSIGEGEERKIHLMKKDEKMSIDIDGDDI